MGPLIRGRPKSAGEDVMMVIEVGMTVEWIEQEENGCWRRRGTVEELYDQYALVKSNNDFQFVLIDDLTAVAKEDWLSIYRHLAGTWIL